MINDLYKALIEDSSATKDRIIFAAIELVYQKGYADLTLKAVCERAGISLGNLTYYFPGRDDLITSLFMTILERYEKRFEHIGLELSKVRNDDATLAISNMVDWMLADSLKKTTATLFIELWALAKTNESFYLKLANIYEQGIHSFLKILGIEEENPGFNSARSALYFLAAICRGGSSIFLSLPEDHPDITLFKQHARTAVIPMLESAVALNAKESCPDIPAPQYLQEMVAASL